MILEVTLVVASCVVFFGTIFQCYYHKKKTDENSNNENTILYNPPPIYYAEAVPYDQIYIQKNSPPKYYENDK